MVLAGLKGNREIPLRTDLIINRALMVRGAFGVDAEGMADAIALIESRRFPLEKMHTHTFGLDQAALAIETLGGEVPGESAIQVSVQPAAGGSGPSGSGVSPGRTVPPRANTA